MINCTHFATTGGSRVFWNIAPSESSKMRLWTSWWKGFFSWVRVSSLETPFSPPPWVQPLDVVEYSFVTQRSTNSNFTQTCQEANAGAHLFFQVTEPTPTLTDEFPLATLVSAESASSMSGRVSCRPACWRWFWLADFDTWNQTANPARLYAIHCKARGKEEETRYSDRRCTTIGLACFICCGDAS